MAFKLLTILAIPSLVLTAKSSAPETYVDLVGQSMETILTVQTCAGLQNRDMDSFAGVYTFLDQYDYDWLSDITGVSDPMKTDVTSFISSCLSKTGSYIVYDYSAQQALIPSLITLAAVLDAPLVEGNYMVPENSVVVYNAAVEWAGYTPLQAAQYVYDNYINSTTTLAWMNPGYDNAAKPSDPPLTKEPHLGLTDFVVKERIFAFYLNDACRGQTDEGAFMLQMSTTNPWPRPIPVYGYNDVYPVAGDIFEAETNCNSAHNMGQIASDGVNNLSYLNRRSAISTPMVQNPTESEVYNSSKTYMMFVMGDGDNIQYLETTRRQWMQQRIDYCAADPSYMGCFPLTWSISPHISYMAPDWLDWYYTKAMLTKHDYFMLPPCGDLYSYPAEMPTDVLDNYVANTEKDGQVLSTSGTIEWEWIGHWKKAMAEYFPKYAAHNIIRGIFTTNVPFMLPVPTLFQPGEYFKVVAGNVVVFKPREWRGTDDGAAPFTKHNYLSVDQMAYELNHLPSGTVSWIYMTSDGGAGIDMLYDLVKTLDEHVKVVNHETLVDLALQKGV